MEFLNKWERKFGWMSFPGLLRYYAIFLIMVFLLQFLDSNIIDLLEFDLEKILSGEVWRAVTFLFSVSVVDAGGSWGLISLIIMVFIAFMVSDGLEGEWGVFRTSMFHYAGFLGLLVANVLCALFFKTYLGTSFSLPGMGMIFYSAAFFAFATLFPKVELLLFFILPVQVRWIALVAVLTYIYSAYQNPLMIGYLVLGFANYLLWAGIPAMRGQVRVAGSAVRKRKFEKMKFDDEISFHRCEKCGRTEVSDPELEFRITADGHEYCEEHLEM